VSKQEREDLESSGSFAQQYDPNAKEATRLFLYCRLCRRTFPVTFRPRPTKRLKCLCGHETAVSEFDVFSDEKSAKDFAALYERIYSAAKQALVDARIAIPPSGKLPQIRDGMDPPSGIEVHDSSVEDQSDIASSYVDLDDSDAIGAGALRRERELRDAALAAGDVLERHQLLSDLIEFLYVRRHKVDGAGARMVEAAREDIELAPKVVRAAREGKKAGRDVRIAFTSFKHLAIVLEEKGDIEGAIEVVEAARDMGLKGYDERAQRLKRSLPVPPFAPAARHDAHAPDVDEREESDGPGHGTDDAVPIGLRSEDKSEPLPAIEVPLDDDEESGPPRRRTSKRMNKR
jgi:hypothetical protein